MEEYAKPKQSSPLWFGPRLGRKKRNQHLDDFDEFLSADCEQVEDYIRSIPWSMVEKCSLNGTYLDFTYICFNFINFCKF